MVAVPDTAGVHWNTHSGAFAVAPAQLPLWALVPLVVPPNAPPCAGITCALPQLPSGVVVVLVEVLVLEEDDDVLVDVLVVEVVLVEEELVELELLELVEELVVTEDDVLLLEDELDVLLLVVVLVVGTAGGVTVRMKGPLEPPHDAANPSTMMK